MLRLGLKRYRRFLGKQDDKDGFHLVEFEPGLTIITGSNGSGKTTLLEAISYALYGPRHGQKGDVASDNTTGGAEVLCEIEIDGQPIKVRRKNTSCALWVNDTLQVQPLPGSVSEAKKQLMALLGGLAPEQFEQTYFARQGDTAGLVDATSGQRQQAIAEILQLDVLKDAAEQQAETLKVGVGQVVTLAEMLADELRMSADQREEYERFQRATTPGSRHDTLQRFQQSVSAAVAERKNRALGATGDLQRTSERVAALVELYNQLKENNNSIAEQLKVHETKKRDHDAFETPIHSQGVLRDRADKELKSLRQRVEAAEACRNAAAQYEQLQSDIRAYDDRLKKLPEIKAGFTRLTQAQDRVAKANKALQKLGDVDQGLIRAMADEASKKQFMEELGKDPTEDERIAWQQRRAAFDHQQKETMGARTALENPSANSICPACGNFLESHQRAVRLSHLQQWLEIEAPRLENELLQVEERIAARQKAWEQRKAAALVDWQTAIQTLTTAQGRMTSRNGLLTQLTEAQNELQAAEVDWSALEETKPYDPNEAGRIQAAREQAKTTSEQLLNEAKLYDRLSELQADEGRKAAELAGYEQAITDLKNQQAQVGYMPMQHQAAINALAAAQASVQEAQNELSGARQLEVQCRNDEQQAQQSLQKAVNLNTRFEDQVTTYLQEEQLHDWLAKFHDHFFAANSKQVSQRATELLWDAVTDGSMMGIEFDASGNLYYRDASYYRRPITATRPSGGEKALIGLCLRLALAERAQAIARTGRIRLLILDEVLSTLDDERRDGVQRVFEDVLLRGWFDHILMITHIDAVKQGWRANGLEVRKVGTKTSEAVPTTLGQLQDLTEDGAEE